MIGAVARVINTGAIARCINRDLGVSTIVVTAIDIIVIIVITVGMS